MGLDCMVILLMKEEKCGIIFFGRNLITRLDVTRSRTVV
jgi:hypothetical protein